MLSIKVASKQELPKFWIAFDCFGRDEYFSKHTFQNKQQQQKTWSKIKQKGPGKV